MLGTTLTLGVVEKVEGLVVAAEGGRRRRIGEGWGVRAEGRGAAGDDYSLTHAEGQKTRRSADGVDRGRQTEEGCEKRNIPERRADDPSTLRDPRPSKLLPTL